MLCITVDKNSKMTLSRQVYEQIRTLILRGILKAGDRLPATRMAASETGVSRNVIIEAYEQLTAEGYVESRQGSATWVAEGAFLEKTVEKKPETPCSSTSFNSPKMGPIRDIVDFRSGVPALEYFPRKEWGRILQEVCNKVPKSVFGYCPSEGMPELQYALTEYLLRTRGIDCRPEQVFITSGATQGLYLVSKLLYSSNPQVVVEEPSNAGLLKLFTIAGYRLYPIPVDNSGMRTGLLPGAEKVSFVYVTPSHQYPIGGVLSVQRRIELVNYAKNTGCLLVEDDYDSEFRYEGAPLSSLYSLDPGSVIYLGTFSKVFAPSLRLGYVILPDNLVKLCRRYKRYTDVHSNSIEQLAMASFIREGKLERHISKMKKVYFKRRKAIITALETEFGEGYSISGAATGLHLVVEIEGVAFSAELLRRAAEEGVKLYPVEECAKSEELSTVNSRKLIMGYGHLSAEEIKLGIKRLKKVIVGQGENCNVR